MIRRGSLRRSAPPTGASGHSTDGDVEPDGHRRPVPEAGGLAQVWRAAFGLLILSSALPGSLFAQAPDGITVTNSSAVVLSASELDRQLTALEERMKEALNTYRVSSEYRKKCADHQRHDRAIRFFRELVAARPDNWRARLELACAYIDKIPTCTGLAAFVNRGALASEALEQQDIVIAKQPDLWVAYYTRGLNHLYWPRVLRHSDDAVKDLTKCVAIQAQNGGQGGRPCYLRVHIALGDACTKQGEYRAAREAWQRGLKAFPDSKAIKARLQIKDDAVLLKYVESERRLDTPVDTSLGFLDDAVE